MNQSKRSSWLTIFFGLWVLLLFAASLYFVFSSVCAENAAGSTSLSEDRSFLSVIPLIFGLVLGSGLIMALSGSHPAIRMFQGLMFAFLGFCSFLILSLIIRHLAGPYC